MFRWITAVAVIMTTISSAVASEEHGHHCLDHHWFNKEYTHEIHWQMAALGILLLLYAVPKAFLRFRRRSA